jgi:hypothetical protein
LQKKNGVKEEDISKEVLYKTTDQSKSRSGDKRQYKDLLEGRFRIEKVAHIERENDENAISNKAFDFSTKTIKQLIEDGKSQTEKYLNSEKYLMGRK